MPNDVSWAFLKKKKEKHDKTLSEIKKLLSLHSQSPIWLSW